MSKTNIEIEDEKEKDRIVQEIYDTLEANRWGDGCDLLVVKVVFIGRLNLKPLYVYKNKPVRFLNNNIL
ncbi:MAG TPA: hypothetical protein DDY52_03340 [Candidatus Moranbacteria bacterium]|nr:hypothetical protein [Candidatus Moranbacteria bacterium]